MADEGLVEKLLVASLKVEKQWQELRVKGVWRREREAQKAELHMMSEQHQHQHQHLPAHFEAGSVGRRATDVDAGSWKTKVLSCYLLPIAMEEIPLLGHRCSDIAWKCPWMDWRGLKCSPSSLGLTIGGSLIHHLDNEIWRKIQPDFFLTVLTGFSIGILAQAVFLLCWSSTDLLSESSISSRLHWMRNILFISFCWQNFESLIEFNIWGNCAVEKT